MKGSIIAFDPCPHCENHDMCSKCELTFRRNGVIANPCEWVSVEERLPETDTRVLVYMHENRMSCTKIDTDRIVARRWVRWGDLVTHWMPLPEAPKGGAE
jgi:hypothetical protein